jgi:hypothetical protein
VCARSDGAGARPDLLVEDDHAAAVAGAPRHTLVDRERARWAVLRSTSKTHGPDLRLAWLAGDRETLGRVEGRQRIGFRWVSHLLQRIVFELESDPASLRRVQRAARAYAERRKRRSALGARGIGRTAFGFERLGACPEEARRAARWRRWFAVRRASFRRAGLAICVTIAGLPLRGRPADAIAASLGPGRRGCPWPRGAASTRKMRSRSGSSRDRVGLGITRRQGVGRSPTRRARNQVLFCYDAA